MLEYRAYNIDGKTLGGKHIKHYIFLLIIFNIVIPILFINILTPIKSEIISDFFEISLYIRESDEIVKIPFEEYISQVVYAEMPASFEIEALKAQAIAVRSYTYRKINSKNHKNYDICDDPKHCQAWKAIDTSEDYKKIVQAVESTKGKIALYGGDVINAVYHASSGGFTEAAINVWNGHEDYLISVESPNEEKIMKDYTSEIVLDKKEFLKKLELKESKKVIVEILYKTIGNRIKEIRINQTIFTGNRIREIFNLRSSNFEVFLDWENIKFVVCGYGHGVGLSQWGAQVMALEGKKAE